MLWISPRVSDKQGLLAQLNWRETLGVVWLASPRKEMYSNKPYYISQYHKIAVYFRLQEKKEKQGKKESQISVREPQRTCG